LRKVPEFENKTALQTGISANDLDFVSQISCQRLLIKLWYNRVMPDTNKLLMYSSLAVPFLAPWLVNFDFKDKQVCLDLF
jgi:hypothetical protein